jgi:MarR family transcriptional regulator for hemolysin
MNKLGDVIFYSMDKAIRTYRTFAQHRLAEAGSDLTVDQWLVLNVVHDNPGLRQGAIAELVFKDGASVTRMIALMVRDGFISRAIPEHDRRTVRLALTRKGQQQLRTLRPVVERYREHALSGVSDLEIQALDRTLRKIMANCDE